MSNHCRDVWTVSSLQQAILKAKEESGAFILAHSYQSRAITEIADFVGDSFALSKKAAETDCKAVIMCGVRFMAETVKILSPEKKVILANSGAACPMAEQLDVELLSALKEQYKDYTAVAYINTTAELKTICDVCVTSSSAVEIVKKLENDKILFIPDCNLGSWVEKQVPEKTFKFVHGGCPTHAKVSALEVKKAKALHPNALFLVHPECKPEVVKEADYVGSTSGIMNFAKNSDAKEFIIGTETSIAEHLSFECRDKRFYPLSKDLICPNMKLTTLSDVYYALTGGGEEISLSKETIKAARRCIDRMIELG
ncbi:MAG: quinolinate synthase NadA [Oscillospiraceae bacterium]|nr:quinolinate synthase NadA [Oscillospiraceae bacterium]